MNTYVLNMPSSGEVELASRVNHVLETVRRDNSGTGRPPVGGSTIPGGLEVRIVLKRNMLPVYFTLPPAISAWPRWRRIGYISSSKVASRVPSTVMRTYNFN